MIAPNSTPHLDAARRTLVPVLAGMMLFTSSVGAAEIRVMISGGFSAAYLELVPEFERATGHTVVTARGA